jgi:hypothetical protein
VRVDRHFIKQQYDLCRDIRTVAELRRVYNWRDRAWPICYDTETTALDFGVPNVLFDPVTETVVSEQLYPVVFGISLAIVVQSKYVTDGTNGMYLCWARKPSDMFDAACEVLEKDQSKLCHNVKFDSRVTEANDIKVGGQQNCSMVMSRMYWNRRRSVGLKKMTEFLCPVLSQWQAPVDRGLARLKSKYTRLYNKGELEWYDGVDYANFSFIAESIMSTYASVDAFMTMMLWMRLQGEADWR